MPFEYIISIPEDIQQVRLVQKLDTGKIYALKSLDKNEMLKRDQVSAYISYRSHFMTGFSARACSRGT